MTAVHRFLEWLFPPPEFPLPRLRRQLGIAPLEPLESWRMVETEGENG